MFSQTKVHKLKKNVSFYNRVINIVPKVNGTEEFWNDLKHAVIMGKPVTYDQYSALYYAVALCRTAVASKQPQVYIMSLEDVRNMEQIEQDLQNPYEQLNQDLYVTLILTKENGKDFAEGSVKFTDQQYKEFHQMIMSEITGGIKKVAEKYVQNLHKLNVQK
jgi:hypothetical protein